MAEELKAWTPLEVVKVSADFLAKHGVESPRLDAEHLLAHVLGVDRLQLYVQFDRPLVPAERERARELVRQRAQRVPLQLLVGESQVYDLSFAVKPGVFIPRPETETLIQVCAERFNGSPPATFVEVGVGTGIVAVSLLHRWPQARAVGFDVSPAAIALTQENALRHEVHERLELHTQDVLVKGWPRDSSRVELLVSNPPYIPEGARAGLSPEVRDHDPAEALFSGGAGMDAIEQLTRLGQDMLSPGGWLVFEHGAEQGALARECLMQTGYVEVVTRRDLADRDRVTLGRRD